MRRFALILFLVCLGGVNAQKSRDPYDYYAILGLEHTASQEEITKAYRFMSRLWDPDMNRAYYDIATEICKRLAVAYIVLSNPEKREVYDSTTADGTAMFEDNCNATGRTNNDEGACSTSPLNNTLVDLYGEMRNIFSQTEAFGSQAKMFNDYLALLHFEWRKACGDDIIQKEVNKWVLRAKMTRYLPDGDLHDTAVSERVSEDGSIQFKTIKKIVNSGGKSLQSWEYDDVLTPGKPRDKAQPVYEENLRRHFENPPAEVKEE
ncbi:hypothetical protein BgAZ_202760 [Babesia gibsoni]|uniref:J domain-containing protein n=1 Tax=Babesia gibsoni TaxID=33632 RepID=A0AAD8P9C4_BABGI|nr:hypothetical protein BgAZ_202760 [Babesia gibsoni]